MINIAIIGVGDIALKRHIPAILEAPDAGLYGFYNRHLDRTRQLAERFKVYAFDSLEEIWNSENVDAVLISTPPDSHGELAVRAMAAGKHVLLEKPMTRSVQEAEQIRQAASQYGRKLMLLHVQRFYEPHQKAKALLDGGEIGKLLTIRSTLGNADLGLLQGKNPPDWQDALYNVGIHRIDLMRWFVGAEAAGVYCHRSSLLRQPEPGILRTPDDHVIGILQYENGVVGTLTASLTSFHGEDRSTVLIGTEGTITTYDRKAEVVLEKRGGEKEYFDFASAHPQNVWELTDAHQRFCESIIKDTAPPVTAEDGVESVRIAVALERADREKRFVLLEEV